MSGLKTLEYHAADFARLAGVNKKTLLYYDEIGLFHPIRVEPNGYRVYSWFQLDRLALIAALRDLGVPLEEIRTYLSRSDPKSLDEMLTRQSEELERRISLLEKRRTMLEGIRAQNREFVLYCGQGPQLLRREAAPCAVLLDWEHMRGRGHLVVNYLTDGLETGFCVDGENSFLYQRRADGSLTLPGGWWVCLYEQVGDPGEKLQVWAGRRRPALETYAKERGYALARPMYVELNELAPGVDGQKNTAFRLLRIPVENCAGLDEEK